MYENNAMRTAPPAAIGGDATTAPGQAVRKIAKAQTSGPLLKRGGPGRLTQ